MTVGRDRMLHAADVAYGAFYPQTDPKFTGKERAWRGDPGKNPLLRPLEGALEVLEYGRALELLNLLVTWGWGADAPDDAHRDWRAATIFLASLDR